MMMTTEETSLWGAVLTKSAHLGIPAYQIQKDLIRLRDSDMQLQPEQANAYVDGGSERLQSIKIACQQLENQALALAAIAEHARTTVGAKLGGHKQKADDLNRRMRDQQEVVSEANGYLELLKGVTLDDGHAAMLRSLGAAGAGGTVAAALGGMTVPAITTATDTHSSISSVISLYDTLPTERLRSWFRYCDELVLSLQGVRSRCAGSISRADAAMLALVHVSNDHGTGMTIQTPIGAAAAAGVDARAPADAAGVTTTPGSEQAIHMSGSVVAHSGTASAADLLSQASSVVQAQQIARTAIDGHSNSVGIIIRQTIGNVFRDNSMTPEQVIDNLKTAKQQCLALKQQAVDEVGSMHRRDELVNRLQRSMRHLLQSAAITIIDGMRRYQAACDAVYDEGGTGLAVEELTIAVDQIDRPLTEISNLRVLPLAYEALRQETLRRKAFNTLYEAEAAEALARLHAVRQAEVDARTRFAVQYSSHLPSCLLRSMEKLPPVLSLHIVAQPPPPPPTSTTAAHAPPGPTSPLEPASAAVAVGDDVSLAPSWATAADDLPNIRVGSCIGTGDCAGSIEPGARAPQPATCTPTEAGKSTSAAVEVASLRYQVQTLQAELASLLAVSSVPRHVAARYMCLSDAVRAAAAAAAVKGGKTKRNVSASPGPPTTGSAAAASSYGSGLCNDNEPALLRLQHALSIAETVVGSTLPPTVESGAGEVDPDASGSIRQDKEAAGAAAASHGQVHGQVQLQHVLRLLRMQARGEDDGGDGCAGDAEAEVAKDGMTSAASSSQNRQASGMSTADTTGVGTSYVLASTSVAVAPPPPHPQLARLSSSVASLLQRHSSLHACFTASNDQVAALIQYACTNSIAFKHFSPGCNVLFFPFNSSGDAVEDARDEDGRAQGGSQSQGASTGGGSSGHGGGGAAAASRHPPQRQHPHYLAFHEGPQSSNVFADPQCVADIIAGRPDNSPPGYFLATVVGLERRTVPAFNDQHHQFGNRHRHRHDGTPGHSHSKHTTAHSHHHHHRSKSGPVSFIAAAAGEAPAPPHHDEVNPSRSFIGAGSHPRPGASSAFGTGTVQNPNPFRLPPGTPYSIAVVVPLQSQGMAAQHNEAVGIIRQGFIEGVVERYLGSTAYS